MKKTFKKYFIPHEANDHKPHFLREKSVALLAAIAVFLLLASIAGTYIVNNSKFLASIQSAFLVDLANEDRQISGASRLVVSERLTLAAQLKANDMAEKGYFAHTSPDGITPWHWFAEAKYQYVYAGENLAVNFSRSEDVQRAWMNSPTHRANILNNRYKEVGIATAEGEYKGRKAIFVVQMFGTPSAGMLNALATPPVPTPASAQSAGLEISPIVAGEFDFAPESLPVLLAQNQSEVVNSENNASFVVENTQMTEEVIEIEPVESFAPVNNMPIQNIAGEDDANEIEILPYTNKFQRFLINPSGVVNNAYTILFALILFSLVLKIFIAIRKQHPKNIFFGVLLLILILIFMYINQEMFTNVEVLSLI